MKHWPVATLASGLVILLGAPMLGVFGTSLAMMQSFGQLGQSGISDPAALAAHIGRGLLATSAGLLVAAVLGLPLTVFGGFAGFWARRTKPDVKWVEPVAAQNP